MSNALHEGPWFLAGNFLKLRRWEPNFIPEAAIVTHTAIWIRLPQLPIEFYDRNIFKKLVKNLVDC